MRRNELTVPSDEQPLYVARRKIYPQSVHGRFRTIKWALLAITLGIYYLLPFVRWDRGAGAPSQAVLLDFPGRRFYFFFIEIWPQEVYYITGLLILAAVALFLMNALAGRIWCGYLCPQTVWTDLFYAVERLIEGDRQARLRHASDKPTLETVLRKGLKHGVWLTIAWWTGGAWVLYFADAPSLVYQLATFTAPTLAYVWIGILTFTTYTLAGHMREQVCTYMCPWPRIQAALTDEDALNVTYRYDRGEPRGSVKKNAVLKAAGLPAGDCIDCDQCVAVCPTGVDIRKGLQLDCIQCGLCIDACDTVMKKIHRPTGLIAYDTDQNIRRRLAGEAPRLRLLRPRTLFYGGLIVVVGAVMLYSLATRTQFSLSVLHDRNPMYVRLSDGHLRNAYTLRVINKQLQTRTFALSVEGLENADVEAVGSFDKLGGRPLIEVEADRTREIRVLVTAAQPPAGATPLHFVLAPADEGTTASASDSFQAP